LKKLIQDFQIDLRVGPSWGGLLTAKYAAHQYMSMNLVIFGVLPQPPSKQEELPQEKTASRAYP
jgi:hypothetical protein